jgi:Zinc carboxypeptidase
MKITTIICLLFVTLFANAQSHETIFEKSKGKQSATYFNCIDYYKQLDKAFATINLKTFGLTDAGYPLHLALFSADKNFDPKQWHQQGKVVMLINNGIHPGEPDGIDASMMLLRDLAIGKIKAPKNVVVGFIPVYNIGGCLNRNSFSRVNQNGPEAYGFRGNAQNLDLNRDFIKSDSKEAKVFAEIFHYLNPDIFIDNHVSDGADYQHTMTLLTTQQSKLGGEVGKYLHEIFELSLYKGMENKNWKMCPYVNFETANPDKGWEAFYDPPRYSSGYATLFSTMAFVPETHMLKPFANRVNSTYALMQTMLEEASKQAKAIKQARANSIAAIARQNQFALSWKVDSTQTDNITFLGYEADKKISEVTGMERLFYNHEKPFTKQVKFYNYFIGEKLITKPIAYIIPQGWYAVINLLALNGVQMKQLQKDSTLTVEAYKIENYKTSPRAYEKHYKHIDVVTSKQIQTITFLKGDYIIYTGQSTDRFVVETLEPTAEDSYFNWNFFDAILQQKEGYSDYRWEDVAASYLAQHPELKTKLEVKKKEDAKFAASAAAQLDFVYKNSPYYEPTHLRYPVYRLVK